MNLLVVGVSHRTAPVDLLERLTVAREETPGLLRRLVSSPYVGEADFRRAVEPAAECGLFVAVGDDGGPVGYVYVQDNASEQEAYVDYLGVLPSHRGRGIGRALIEGVYAQARAAGASEVYWQTHESNSAGRLLYDKVAKHHGYIVYETPV